jgi:hypothetical protein
MAWVGSLLIRPRRRGQARRNPPAPSGPGPCTAGAGPSGDGRPGRPRSRRTGGRPLLGAGCLGRTVQPGVDDDGGPVGVRISGDPGRAHRHQGIGPAGVHGPVRVFLGHHREGMGQALQRPGHHRSVGPGELPGQPEPGVLLGVPPPEGPGPLGLPGGPPGRDRCRRSPFSRMHPTDTPWAHLIRCSSVSGVANRASSTTSSIPR